MCITAQQCQRWNAHVNEHDLHKWSHWCAGTGSGSNACMQKEREEAEVAKAKVRLPDLRFGPPAM